MSLRILSQPSDLGGPQAGVCIALGMFDGVHLGHQHVARHAVLDARALGAVPVAVTFDPHPQAVVAPDRAPRLLQTLSQRLRALAENGIEAALPITFTRELSLITGADFIRHLATGFGRLRSVTVGQGFHFGHQRSGNVPLLRTLGRELGFVTHAAAPIHVGAERVSSTRIRTALREGRLAHVAELLGRPYALAGKVVAGRRLARQLGFPTANVEVSGLELPPFGVYAARVRLDAVSRPAVINLGVRPTVDPAASSGPLLEVHLPGFEGDLYGREIEVELARFIRPERRFASVEALRDQIQRDVQAAEACLQ